MGGWVGRGVSPGVSGGSTNDGLRRQPARCVRGLLTHAASILLVGGEGNVLVYFNSIDRILLPILSIDSIDRILSIELAIELEVELKQFYWLQFYPPGE